MPVKLFLLGPPGSGKSTAYRYIRTYLQDQQVERVNDFEILKRMFDADTKRQQFHATKKHGFIVKDLSVFDEALQQAKRILIEKEQLLRNAGKFLIIEFSRNDYRQALQFFLDSLQDSYFLLMSANKNICQKRLKERVTEPPTEDNHYVSSTILKDYYNKAAPYESSHLINDFKIEPERVKGITNNGSLDYFETQVLEFVDVILRRETVHIGEVKVPTPHKAGV